MRREKGIEFHSPGGGINLFRHFVCAAAFVAAAPTLVTGNEIDGFRLGMTMEQAMKMAAERNYSFGKAVARGTNWTAWQLEKDGPAITFCSNELVGVVKTTDSNLHQLAHTLERWTKSLGAPETVASQTFEQGVPYSSLNYGWVMQGNVKFSLNFHQLGTANARISYGYNYIKDACGPSTR